MVRKSKYTKDLLQPIVEMSHSMAEVLRKLGLKITGGNYKNISYRIKYLEISIKHFDTLNGQSWAKGKTKETDDRVAKCAKKNSFSNEEVFVENAPPMGGGRLAKRLLILGWQYKCGECGLTEWRGKTITLHLDHINGMGNDNRFENLRFLCPNCHQQTETWGNRSNKSQKEKVIKEKVINKCVDCKTNIHRQATRCRSCASKLKTKIDWPTDPELKSMVENSSFLAVGRELGVSDKAVRKRLLRNKSIVQ